MDDEDAVTQLLSQRQSHEKDEAGIKFLGWTYERELLTTICDLLTQVHATLIQVNSENGRRPDMKPFPRPRGAIEKIASRQALIDHRQRVKMLTPH